MAVRLIPSSISASASAGAVKACTAYNLSADPTSGNQFRDDLGTSRNSGTFTIPNGTVMSGCGIWFQTGTRAGFFNIKLQKGGVDVAGATVSLAVNSTNFPAGYGFRTFTFGTPATGDGSSTYRLVAQCTTATAFGGSAQNSSMYWFRDTTAANYSYVTVDNSDTATGITSGDTLVLDKGVQLTIDQNTTLAPVTADKPSLWLGDGASWKVTANGYTLDLGNGCIDMSSNSFDLVGTSGTPISAGLNFIIKTSITAGGTLFRSHYVLINNGNYTRYHEWYGATSDTWRLHIGTAYSGSNAAGQAKVTFSDAIPGTWAVGDSLHDMGKDQTGGDTQNSGAYYTIAAAGIDSANKTVTRNANLSTKLITDFPGIVVNVTELSRCMGIQINSTNTIYLDAANQQSGNDQMHHIVLKGIYAKNCQLGTRELTGASSTVDGYVCEYGANAPSYPSFFSSYVGGATVNNVVTFSRNTTNTGDWYFAGLGLTVSNCWVQGGGNPNSSTTNGWICNSSTFTNCGAVNQVGISGYTSINLAGYGNTLNNVYLIGASWRCAGNSHTLNNVAQQRSLNLAGQPATCFLNSVGCVFNNCTFGVGTSNGSGLTYDLDVNLGGFGYPTPQFIQAVFNNCNVGSRGVNTTQTAVMNNNSYLEFHNYNGTVGDHRTYKRLGTFTTPNPYTSLVQEVNQSTSYLSHQFSLLTQTIASKQHYLVLTGQVAAAYYAGTHSVPKVDIYADGNSSTPLATLSLADSTSSAQTLSQAFTPTTNNNQIVLDFQTKTDATGTNADCTWSNAKIIQRIYGQTFTSTDLGITETLTYPITTLTTPVSNPFITVSNQATVHAYTQFAWNSGTSTLTISGNATIPQMYDWSQDYAATHPTEAVWLTTVDGINFTLSGNLVINTGVTLSGSSSQRLSLGSNTLTLNGTATTSGVIVTDVSGTHSPIVISGFTNTSTVYILDTTTSTTILKAVVGATSTTQFVTLSGDHNLTIIIRDPNYYTYETTGVVGVNGFSLNVSQISFPVYADTGINGAGVTEFSFSGSQVKIFLNSVTSTTVQKLIAWYFYTIATPAYINLQVADMSCPSAVWAKLLNNGGTQMQIKNISASPITISGGNVTDANNVSETIVDTTGNNIYFVSSEPASNPLDMATAIWSSGSALSLKKFIGLK